MSGINGFNNYFSSNTNSTGTMNFGISLTDYASIKNGSYRKLLRATYSQQDKEEKASKTKDTDKTLSVMKSGADALKASADALTSHSLWDIKTIKEKDEKTGEVTTKKDYDWNSITKAVKSFVDDYNSVIEKAGSSDTKGVLRNAAWMTQATEKNSKLLKEVGITVGDDNKLTLDEDKLKSASIGTLKSLFEGSGSYADQIANKAGNISRSAKQATDNYNKDGQYNKTSSAASAILAGNTDGVTGSSSTGKTTYQISDDMKKAIVEQVKLDYYMYGGKASSDSKTYTNKVNDYLKGLDSKNRSSASWTINQFRDELSNQVAKQIKAQVPGWSNGSQVSTSVLDRIFQDDELMKKVEEKVYGGSVNVGV